MDNNQDKPKKARLPPDPWKGDPNLRTVKIAEKVEEDKPSFTGDKSKKDKK